MLGRGLREADVLGRVRFLASILGGTPLEKGGAVYLGAKREIFPLVLTSRRVVHEEDLASLPSKNLNEIYRGMYKEVHHLVVTAL